MKKFKAYIVSEAGYDSYRTVSVHDNLQEAEERRDGLTVMKYLDNLIEWAFALGDWYISLMDNYYVTFADSEGNVHGY